ncbi:MAG: hydrolase [Gammaproteobacteria bacterium]|jgi:predicted alpha/beta-fold hydrolase
MMDNFKAAWWCSNPHCQTIFPTFFRKPVQIELNEERLITADNDFLDIAYPDDNDGDLVLVFHGLEGSLQSHYSRGMLKALYDTGLYPVFMHFRGCSGEANKTTRRYYSAETSDPTFLLDTFQQRYPERNIYAVGFSLGGNMLLKWLNDLGEQTPIQKAVAISVPFDLSICDKRLQHGLSRIYLKHLLDRLHEGIRLKYDAGLFPHNYKKAMNSKTFWEFDEYATAPLHGFEGADDYYAKCSSKFYLENVHTPTLIIQAKDDPFITADALPSKNTFSSAITLELTDKGGHVGFISGNNPFNPEYWAEQRTVEFFNNKN